MKKHIEKLMHRLLNLQLIALKVYKAFFILSKSPSLFIALVIGLGCSTADAQVINLGYKYQEKGMFNATLNYPMVFNRRSPHEFMLGVDYSTKNSKAPSGLTPQASYAYYLKNDSRSYYLLMAGLSTGYQFALHGNYKSQFKISPFIYTEFIAVLNLKVGYDYMMPLQKGYPYISIGIGGLHMLKFMSFM